MVRLVPNPTPTIRPELQGGIIPILARAINCCWCGFKWTVVLAVVAGAVAAVCLYRRVDEEIRRQVETESPGSTAA